MLLWCLLILIVFVAGTGAIAFSLMRNAKAGHDLERRKLSSLQTEVSTKETLLEEIANLTLGLANQEDFEDVNNRLKEAEESLRAEQGRFTITQAERDTVESRLRELEELERELEASSQEASRQVEMLQSQEKDIKGRNDQLIEKLETTFAQIDNLLAQLESSSAASEQIARTKTDLIEVQGKIGFYTDEIASLNNKYMTLKTAYDALDIEYAQIYEKQHMMELGEDGEDSD